MSPAHRRMLNGNNGNLNALVIRAVNAVSTNANLAGLKLNPAGTLTPGFASNVLFYAATEACGSAPTLMVTNASLSATNQMIYNSVTNILPPGSPSAALTLDPNPGVTNVVQVRVTAQDGVTVQTYTVNVIQLPNQTKPALTLNWPLDHLGCRLLMQTNNLASGFSLNIHDWTTVANFSGTNQVVLPIDPTKPTEFYRLVYP